MLSGYGKETVDHEFEVGELSGETNTGAMSGQRSGAVSWMDISACLSSNIHTWQLASGSGAVVSKSAIIITHTCRRARFIGNVCPTFYDIYRPSSSHDPSQTVEGTPSCTGRGSPRPFMPRRSPRADPGCRARVHSACLLYTSPSPRDRTRSRMPSSA